MTTIAWDGKTLAADTRVSTMKDHRDNSAKLHRFVDEVLFQGSPILAVGTSGNAKLSRGALKVLHDKPDGLETFYKLCIHAEMHPEQRGFSLLIVTVEAVWTFSYSAKGTKLTKSKSPHVATGSGAKVAMYLMTNYGVSSTDAVLAAMSVDKATGGQVMRLKIEGATVAKLPTRFSNKPEEVKRAVAKQIATYLETPVKATKKKATKKTASKKPAKKAEPA